jgi:hypothetical protein
MGEADPFQLISKSRVPETGAQIPLARDGASVEIMFGDAYGVQHHGDESPQAIQSVAVHLLNIHGIISGRTTQPRWALGRAIRVRGVFHKLEPPPLGSALTIRHLFSGGGVTKPVTRHDYAQSVYEAWMALHRVTVEEWYASYVVPDKLAAKDGPAAREAPNVRARDAVAYRRRHARHS